MFSNVQSDRSNYVDRTHSPLVAKLNNPFTDVQNTVKYVKRITIIRANK